MTARATRAAAVSGALVAATGLTLTVAYGAAAEDVLLYLGYEAAFVLLPGCLAYAALSSKPGGALRVLAMGWALGYALEVLAFVATAAIDARALFAAYPPVICAAALVALRARAKGAAPARAVLPTAGIVAVAAVCAVAIAYLAIGSFPFAPLPGEGSFNFFQDRPWALSIAAEAKHHWPIEEASVAGEPFTYHWFVHVHWAAASQVTGLELPLVYFRLFVAPLTAAIVLGAVVAGLGPKRDYRVGVLSVLLLLLVGELQLDTSRPDPTNLPFLGVLFTLLLSSPSFLFGLVFLLPLLTLIGERLSGGEAWRAGDWVVAGLLTVGASQAKVSILPLLLGALVVYGAWTWAAARRPPREAIGVVAMLLSVSVALWLTTYRGHGSGLTPDLLAGVRYVLDMPALATIEQGVVGDLPEAVRNVALGPVGFAAGLAGLLAAQLAGLRWSFPGRGLADERTRWLGSVLAAGLASLLFLDGGGTGNQLYALFYGVAAGCLLSAAGLVSAWDRLRPAARAAPGRLASLVAAAAALAAAVLVLPLHVGPSGPDRYLVWYGGLIVALLGIYLVARAAGQPLAAPLLVAGMLLAIGALDKPVDTLRPALVNPPGEATDGRRVTPALYRALAWLRDETPTDAVVAVNSHWTELGPFEYVHAGFGERRVFLGGWGYTTRARDIGYEEVADGRLVPFPRRLALNDAAFRRASLPALRVMSRRFGVRYLVVDRINGHPVAERALRRIGAVVQRGPGVIVLELPPL